MSARSTSNVDQQVSRDGGETTARPLRLVGRFQSARQGLDVAPYASRPAADITANETLNGIVMGLFESYHDRVFAFLRRLTTAERAEDLTQEVFFRLYRVKNLESRDISVSYLFRMGENLVRKGYHREQRHRRASEELRNRATLQAGIEFDTDSSSRDREQGRSVMAFVGSGALQSAMTLLTNNEQAAIRLIVCQGLSYEQAACSLEVSVSTINNWKHRGVRKLRKIIEDADSRIASDRHGVSDQPVDHGRGRRESREGSGQDQGCGGENRPSGFERREGRSFRSRDGDRASGR